MKNMDERIKIKAQRLQAYLEQLKGQLQGMLEAFTQASITKTALDEITPGREVLVPIGAGSYAVAEVKGKDVIIPIGGNYFIKVPPASAKEKLDKTIERLKKMHEEISKEIEKVEGELIRLLKSMGSM